MMSGIFQDFSNEQWKTGLPDTIQVSPAEYEALQAERDEAVRQRDKFYGEANLERENAATYKTVLEMCVAATGEEIPFGDLPRTVEALRRDAERLRFVEDTIGWNVCRYSDVLQCWVASGMYEVDAAINMPNGEEGE